MKVYDISQELFGSVVFPGNPAPRYESLKRIEDGFAANLSQISLCTHNGTHVDAPRHFVRDGKTIDQMDLNRLVGPCSVIEYSGELSGPEAERLIRGRHPRILWKGDMVFGVEAAEVFVKNGVLLVGVECQTVGPDDARVDVHRLLLGNELAIIEGLRLGDVPEGDYLLSAAPLNLGGLEGSPCRAVLIQIGVE